jgi:zinc protease
MTSLFRWAVAAVAFGFPAIAQDVATYRLENGLDIIVIEDHRAPVVVQMVWYRAGAADEPRGVSGVAHFLEHLMFKGTDTLAPGEFSKTVEANGGSDNAFTSADFTAYYQRVAADRLELVMRMEADRMRNLTLSEDDWRTEREVIIEERNQRTDSDPAAIFAEQRNAAQYLNHPYGIPTIGWRHEMEALTRQDALDWYRKYYAPNNATLVVAGDVEPEAVRALAETYYGPLEPSPDIGPRERVKEPPQLAERRLSYADANVAQPYVIRTYLAPERNTGAQQDAAALTILAEILGGNPQTSVLGRELVFEGGQAIQAGAFYAGASLDPTTFGVYVVPADGVSMADAEAAMDTALSAFIESGVDPAQFERLKTQIHADMIYSRDDTEGLANTYGEAVSSGLTVRDVQDWPAVLEAVTEEDVLAAARALFDRRRAVTGWLLGTGEEEVMQ